MSTVNLGYLNSGKFHSFNPTINVVFPQALPNYYQGFSSSFGFNPAANGFSSFGTTQQQWANYALTTFSNVAKITWAHDGNTASPKISFGFTPITTSGLTFYPIWSSYPAVAGDVFLDASTYLNNSLKPDIDPENRGGFANLLHEIGHALGLDHDGVSAPTEASATALFSDEANTLFTVTSYTYFPLSEGSSPRYPITPMLYDIVQLQVNYGVNTTYNATDTDYTFTDTTHPFSSMGVSARPDQVLMTLWDAGGNSDVINAKELTTSVLIDLREGHFSAIGTNYLQNGDRGFNVGIAFGAKIEHAIGGKGWDLMIGNALGNQLEARDGTDTLYGYEGVDTLIGQSGDDELHGGNDNDQLFGDDSNPENAPYASHGNDSLYGDDGNDTLIGGGKNDSLYGGEGADQLFGDASLEHLAGQHHGSDSLDGGAGDDYLEGGGQNDTLMGGTGNDTLWGDTWTETLSTAEYGSDSLDGGIGDDNMAGGGKADTLIGGEGSDLLIGDSPDEIALADQGDDVLDGGAGSDTLIGNGGNDSLVGGADADDLRGDEGNDTLRGDAGQDVLHGGADNDLLAGGADDDLLAGDAGNDTLQGDMGNDALAGADGADVLQGGLGADSLDGGDGGDLLAGDDGADYLTGSLGDDTLQGGLDSDTLVGGEGNDVLNGGSGNDLLDAGGGTNYVQGGEGADTLVAAAGTYLSGGAGDDTYVFASTAAATLSVIDDFEGHNTLLVSGSLGDYSIYTQGGLALLTGTDGPLATLADTSMLGNLFLGQGTGSVSLLALTEQQATGGRLRSKVWLNGQLVDTASITDNQALAGSSFADALRGGTGADVLQGGSGDDLLSGGAGDDMLVGGAGADEILGGAGNDILLGSGENDDGAADIYRFEAGDGVDRIDAPADGSDGVARDVISFEASVDKSNVQFLVGRTDATTVRADLVIAYGQGDMLTLSSGALAGIAELRFADGTSITRDALLTQLAAGSSAASAFDPDEFESDQAVIGSPAADYLGGGRGNDILIGGAGADVLQGGGGTNIYLFGTDSGTDQITTSRGDGEAGILKFTDASAAQLRVRAEGHDVVIEQSSGASVRIHDLLWPDVDLVNWSVVDASGTSTSLESLLTQPPEGTLEDRRAVFVADQLVALATAPQRSLGTSRYPTEPVVPTSAIQVEHTVDQDGNLTYEHFLTIDDTVQTCTGYASTPVYQTVTVGVPATPARFIKVEANSGIELPEGAVPVWDEEHTLLGYQVPGSPAGTREVARLVGWTSEAYEYTRLVTNDTAIQQLITGSAGNDSIGPGSAPNGFSALFRGSVVTGAGDDFVYLATGDNILDAQEWSRFDEWRDTAFVEAFWTNFGRGRGAWIDLGDGDDAAYGTDANDFIIGGAGSDGMDGQAGADTYFIGYTAGDIDRISDLAYYVYWDNHREGPLAVAPYNDDTVEFDASVELASLSYRLIRAVDWNGESAQVYRTLQLFTNGQHFLDMEDLEAGFSFGYEHAGIEQFRFADGTVMSLEDLLAAMPMLPSAPPELTEPLDNFELFAYQLIDTFLGWHFTDPDGDMPLFSAELADGSALPDFLYLDSALGRLVGTPAPSDVGSYSIRVIATDSHGVSGQGLFQLQVVLPLPVLSDTDYALAPYEWEATLTGTEAIYLIGNDLANVLAGNDVRNVINGRGGDDQLTGGGGNDIFYFDSGSGVDVIMDFNALEGDWICFMGGLNGSSIMDFESVLAATADVDGSARIDLGGGASVILSGVLKEALSAELFAFVG
ncbi:MAG: putative Ig domain-containing protein [Pseudomonadota bacterium]